MNVQQSYNAWSKTYDEVENKTRDLEAFALRQSIVANEPLDILEIGCGTGKNTGWLLTKAKHLVGADFSVEMLQKARAKINDEKAVFRQLDLREKWEFAEHSFDLITASLILEHIENLDFIFKQAFRVLRNNGLFYIGELHPFKQYDGSKARFETGSGIFELECFVHHISDYFDAAVQNNFEIVELKEWFDDEVEPLIPRLLSLVFQKN